MSTGVRSRARAASVLPRVLLVVALVLGLCAMHVLAAAVSRHHAAIHENTTAGAAAVVLMDHTAPAATRAAAPTSPHDHHSAMTDCVLFLSAGVAILLVLVAVAATRALRRSPRVPASWFATLQVTTPQRGPPAWHWPRISLCVVRV